MPCNTGRCSECFSEPGQLSFACVHVVCLCGVIGAIDERNPFQIRLLSFTSMSTMRAHTICGYNTRMRQRITYTRALGVHEYARCC